MEYFQNAEVLNQVLYCLGITVVLGFSLRVVLGTTMLTMLGPGKALRGPDGSMHSAVDGMLDEFEGIAITFHSCIHSVSPRRAETSNRPPRAAEPAHPRAPPRPRR